MLHNATPRSLVLLDEFGRYVKIITTSSAHAYWKEDHTVIQAVSEYPAHDDPCYL